MRLRRSIGLGVAFASLLALGAAQAAESLLHTDDGCAIETHCQACLLALATTGVLTEAVAAAPALGSSENLAPVVVRSQDRLEPGTLPSRGPPLA